MESKMSRTILSVFIASLLLVSCSLKQAKNIQDCKFSFQSISELKANNVSLDGKQSLKDLTPAEVALVSKGLMSDMPITFTAHVKIDNPNNQSAELSALEWILLIRDVEVATGVVDEKVKIGAHQHIILPLDVETNTGILKKFSLSEIKQIIFNISNSKGLPQNSTLKVKPAIVVGKTMIKAPAYFTIDLK